MENFHSYKIRPIEPLGQGSFGYVEKIELYNSNNITCGLYARKVLFPQDDILKNISIEDIKKRFSREVIYQSKCSHQNIIQVFLFNKHVENPYFVMEIGESDLGAELKKNALSEDQKIDIMNMMLLATKKIHDEKYLHRDIKPQNIIKFPGGIYKLSDFGLVKDVDTNSDTTVLTAIGCRMGTTKYMAPEVFIEQEYSKQTDVYALGVVFSELGISSTSLGAIIDKCKNLEKKSRYSSVDEVLRDVNKFLGTITTNKG